MQGEINNIKINMAELKKDISYITEKVDNIEQKLDSWCDDANKNFAPYWVVQWIFGVTIIFALATLYFIFANAGLPTK